MTNKEKYEVFCATTYVPIYSKPWWMDAVCGSENWNVWLYDNGEQILAAMPYYLEQRGEYHYITKAPLTQNNGIIFKEDPLRGFIRQAELEEKVINAACEFIDSLDLDVYEQQYPTSFQNWQPFYWHHYTNMLRYTYVIEDTSDLENVWGHIASKSRNQIRKGQRLTYVDTSVSPDEFYDEHEKVFLKQGRPCPFDRVFWHRFYQACSENNSGQMFCARDENGRIHAVLYLVWDERSVYQLLGGYIPAFSSSQAYLSLIYHGISLAHDKMCSYDFEGSMIHQVAISFRRFGGIPKPYYRIRKVFNPEIVRKEAEDYIQRAISDNQQK